VDSNDVLALPQRIARALARGDRPSDVAKALSCSRTTVYKVAKALTWPLASIGDRRLLNAGRLDLYGEVIAKKLAELRTLHPEGGKDMMAGILQRQPERYGFPRETVPAAATIGRILHDAGLSRRPVGRRDLRVYPDPRPSGPGCLTLAGWGPFPLRATRCSGATCADRFTRLAVAVPVFGGLGREDGLPAGHGGLALSLLKLVGLRENERVERVYSDNGIGMMPAPGRLPTGARVARGMGARVIFIPPAQPWRNGRLERFHWSMEREFWRTERPQRIAEARQGLVDWLNWYNEERPHQGLGGSAPGERHPSIHLEQSMLDLRVPEAHYTTGLVEAIRLVQNDGRVDLGEGHCLHVSPLLGGQYVRVEFTVPGPAAGRVVYNRKRGEDIVVAVFAHELDRPGKHGADFRLFGAVQLVDLVEEPRGIRRSTLSSGPTNKRASRGASRASNRVLRMRLVAILSWVSEWLDEVEPSYPSADAAELRWLGLALAELRERVEEEPPVEPVPRPGIDAR
jgi:transposase InsO family protein